VPLARALGRDVAAVLTGVRHSKRWKSALRHFLMWVSVAAVALLFFAEIVMLNVNLLPSERPVRWAILGLMACAVVFGWKYFAHAGRVACAHFNDALEAEKRRGSQTGALITLTVPSDFYNHLAVSARTAACGASIRTLDVRARTGASIVSVIRDGVRHRNPGPEWVFEAGDVAVAIGEPAQLAALRALLSSDAAGVAQKEASEHA
jgi:hypothetical protein